MSLYGYVSLFGFFGAILESSGLRIEGITSTISIRFFVVNSQLRVVKLEF